MLHLPSAPQHPFVDFLVILLLAAGVVPVPALALSFVSFIYCTTLELSIWFLKDAICFYFASICISYYLLSRSVFYCWLRLFWFLVPIFKIIGFNTVKNSKRVSPLSYPFALCLYFFVASSTSMFAWLGLLS